MSTLGIIKYYVDLLILQYKGKPKARATIASDASMIIQPQKSIQTITFLVVPDQASFILSYNEVVTPLIFWDDTAVDVQSAIRSIPGLEEITVTGNFEDGFIVTFEGVFPVAPLLVVAQNYMEYFNGSAFVPIPITIQDIDETLPIAIQNAFNILPGTKTAIGAQLDVIGKYVGVTRSGRGFSTYLTLNDNDFLLLIRAAIGRNYAGSSLYDIDLFLSQFFPGQIFVTDYANMRLGYFIAPGTLSTELLQAFIGQKLLPKPMGVSIYPIIYTVSNDPLFGFDTYEKVNVFASPYNTYDAYDYDTHYLSYNDVISL